MRPLYDVPVPVPPQPVEPYNGVPSLDRTRRQACRLLEEFLTTDMELDEYVAKQVLFKLEALINSIVPSESKGEDSYNDYVSLVIKKLKVSTADRGLTKTVEESTGNESLGVQEDIQASVTS